MIVETTDFNKLIVAGDRVLLKPKTGSETTKSGLYLPPTVKEKEKVRSGWVMKVGPGYPIPAPADVDDEWKQNPVEKQYFPLQAREGDLAVYLQSSGFEIEFRREKYVIVPHSAILLMVRDDELFE